MTEHTRRNYLRTTGGIAAGLIAGLAGCAGGGSATGTLATRVSDQPGDISDFQECIVTISGIRLTPAQGDPIEQDVDNVDADLVELQGEESTLVDESEFEEGEYESVQLEITDTRATLEDGSDADVSVPGDAPLTFETFSTDGEQSDTFEIRAGETTTFTADFTPVKRGSAGGYVLQPVADETTVSYSGGTVQTRTTSANA